jgi:predicted Zn-dependent protease
MALAATLAIAGVAAALTWWMTTGRPRQQLREAEAAYARGAREVARPIFVALVREQPANPVPLIYLGRMSREDGDLARARTFLTAAVCVGPQDALAARELASLMLADGQPELARRFYVRALELNPQDRTAQGFLGCALSRLQRAEEAQRWIERAGPGDWQRCVAPPMPVMPPTVRSP